MTFRNKNRTNQIAVMKRPKMKFVFLKARILTNQKRDKKKKVKKNRKN